VHIDCAGAEEEVTGDLAIRLPRRDESNDLELAAGQAGPLKTGGSAPAEAAVDLLSQSRELAGSSVGGRLGTELPEGPVGAGQALDGGLL
jgi:hypothetical protein